MKLILVGGSNIKTNQLKYAWKSKIPVAYSYGMTETLTHVAIRNISRKGKKYKAISGVSFGQDNSGCLKINDELLNIHGLQTNDLVNLVIL